MFITKKLYVLQCNKCERVYNSKRYGSLFIERDLAFECAEMDDWKQIKGGHYCPDCCHYNEERDEYVVNH